MKNESPNSPSPSRSSIGGRIWKVIMGALLMVVGSVFVSYLWGAYQRAAIMDTWVETPCVILESSIDDAGRNQKGMPKYTLLVKYEYKIDGIPIVNDRYKRLPTEASDPRKVKSKLDPLEPGTKTICWVDPDDSSTAVLKKDTKAALYSIWFPCLFVIGGAGMVLSALFRK